MSFVPSFTFDFDLPNIDLEIIKIRGGVKYESLSLVYIFLLMTISYDIKGE